MSQRGVETKYTPQNEGYPGSSFHSIVGSVVWAVAIEMVTETLDGKACGWPHEK